MSRPSATLSSATQHAMPPEFSRKWGTECFNTRFPLPILLCAGYSVKLIKKEAKIVCVCTYVLPSLGKWCLGGDIEGSSLVKFVESEGRCGGTAATAGAGGTADSPHHRSLDSSKTKSGSNKQNRTYTFIYVHI